MAIQDYLVHFSLQQCAKHNLVVKFHTGLQEGNGNTIRNSRAALLSNLFFRYPQVRFNIYHISYPYQEELLTLAKNFANVAIDFCWMWIINPAAGRRALSEFLDAVPANKIHGFGGDFIFVEGTYGHANGQGEHRADAGRKVRRRDERGGACARHGAAR
jgi:predicted TIM-barrel fold metal-dependent hydrolase